jgi:hypothetical protein
MGAMHATTIFALPFAGLVFAANRHRTLVGETKDEWSPEVRRAHRTVNVALVVVAIVLGLLSFPLLLGLFGSLIG